MTYYINPIWFYLMNISTELKTVLFILGVVTFASSVFAFIFWKPYIIAYQYFCSVKRSLRRDDDCIAGNTRKCSCYQRGNI